MSTINLKSLYFSYNGRIGRKPFWIGLGGIVAAASVVQAGIFVSVNSSDVMLASLIAIIPFVVPAFALYVKRARDRGLSLWWLLMLAVPVGGLIWMVFDLGMRPGCNEGDTLAPVAAAAASAA